MSKHILIIFCLGLFFIQNVQGQYAHFPQSGVIHYEKRVHVKNFMKTKLSFSKNDGFDRSYQEQLMGKAPELHIFKSKLSFNGQESRYEPVKEELSGIMRNLSWYGFDYSPVYYQSFDTGEFKSLFEYGGSNLITADSLLSVKWKITNEYREIAGYNCRRANGVVLDSVFIVAFYTDDIPLSSGPGALHGLPGMILGLVVPDQHYNIYATKVELTQPVVSSELGRKKDKPMNRQELQQFMRDRMRVGEWNTEQEFGFSMANLLL